MTERALKLAVPLIAKFEGLRLRAYQDSVGVWTIGYGHTKGVKPGDVWTQEHAEAMLTAEVREFMRGVEAKLRVPVTDEQLAALTSFAYNVGLGAYGKSTLLKKLNLANYDAATREFQKWNKAGGRVLAGLTSRRRAESELFERTA